MKRPLHLAQGKKKSIILVAELIGPSILREEVLWSGAVSLTQQQYQQFIDRISGLEARTATLQTHAEAQQEQIRVAEMVISTVAGSGGNPTNPPPPFRAAQERTRDLLDYYNGYRVRSMRSTSAMCLSAEERQTSAPQTWTGSTRNCTRYWPSRQLTRRWHPSSHLKK